MYTAIEKLKFRESFMKLHFPMDIFNAFCECASKSNGALFLLRIPYVYLYHDLKEAVICLIFFQYIKNYEIV